MFTSSIVLVLSAVSTAFARPSNNVFQKRAATCNGTEFNKISAADWVKNANPGWNLGNTLEALPTEGSWNNPPVVPSTFDKVKSSGFNGVRLPVSWVDHFVTGSPTWTINPTWLQRVSDVVDMTTSRGLYTIVNAHGDAYTWADLETAGANYTLIEEQFYAVWYQIGEALGCKSSLLAFEPINEPPADTAAEYAELNKLEGIFIQALSDSGGFNADRVLTLVGPSEDSISTSEYFVAPKNITNPWAIQFHYYSPYPFIFSAWGSTLWGSDADKAALESDFANIRGNFTDIPIFIGEWQATPVTTETAARWKYSDFLVQTANKYNFSTFLWDNGADFLDRATNTWRDQVVIDLIISAANGTSNALPDSQEDDSALYQYSYAYIYHKYGTPVVDTTLTYILNGNTITSVQSPTGTSLESGVDYVVSASNITYTAGLLSQYINATSPTGSIANFTVNFSIGVPVTANLVQWDVPTLGITNMSAAVAVANDSDISIPVVWKGINKPATVRATLADGTCLVETYTIYLALMEQCRTDYSGDWNWDASDVIISAADVAAVVSAGQTTTFSVEFYPREPDNIANFTLTV